MPRKSRDSETERPPLTSNQARTLALSWLGLRELSKAQVRQRLRRRGVAPDVVDEVIASLVDVGALNEERLALAAARRETAIRGRGPVRARMALRALGLGEATVDAALAAALEQVDVEALLDRALDKRLARVGAGPLDRATFRKLVSALVRQGFEGPTVMARLRRRGASTTDDEV
ncbi:MAG: RecX family transcriptional regulator [Acidobacteria bacterium]|nr:RecX family transcriptional regulator [Acidobacteriota bacterium]